MSNLKKSHSAFYSKMQWSKIQKRKLGILFSDNINMHVHCKIIALNAVQSICLKTWILPTQNKNIIRAATQGQANLNPCSVGLSVTLLPVWPPFLPLFVHPLLFSYILVPNLARAMGQLQALALTIPSASSLHLPLAHILVRQQLPNAPHPALSNLPCAQLHIQSLFSSSFSFLLHRPYGYLLLSFMSGGWGLPLKKKKQPEVISIIPETFAWWLPGKIQICMRDYNNKMLTALKGGCLLAFWTRGRMINQEYNQARAVNPVKSTWLQLRPRNPPLYPANY